MLTRIQIATPLTGTGLNLAALSVPGFELGREISIAKSNTRFIGGTLN